MTADEIQRAVCAAGLRPLPPDALTKFVEYFDLLQKWNQRVNLTAIREPKEILNRHLIECIQCALEVPAVPTLLDYGSGAGFPGIPIAILRPEIRVTLGESQAKKASFLREAVRLLGLTSIVYDGRIDSMEAIKQFEAVTMRAVDKMNEAIAPALVRLKPGGWLVLFATETTAPGFKDAAPGIEWNEPVPIKGLDRGFLIIGWKPL